MSKSMREYKCGKCDNGTIQYFVTLNTKDTSVLIKKCDNPKCKYQYRLKEFWKANLTEITEQP